MEPGGTPPEDTDDRPALSARSADGELVTAVHRWVARHVPVAWIEAARAGGTTALRATRSRADYESWYPVFGASGLAVPNWPVEYGGLGLTGEQARLVERELRPLNLGRLNPLGLNLAAPALFAHGTEAQRVRFLAPMVRNEERWCQLFSEPGAGSDLASLSTRAQRVGDVWEVTGQKVWTTWAHHSDFGVLLARTEASRPKRQGITYFLLALDQPGVEVRPLRHLTGEIDFNEVFLDRAEVPDRHRVGAVGDGWRVANATLSGERQMVSGSGSGGVDRIGGSGADRLLRSSRVRTGRAGAAVSAADTALRQRVVGVWVEEQIRARTNERVRSGLRAGRPPGPESSVGKVHQGDLNQKIQLLATDLLGTAGQAWASGRPGDRPDPTGPAVVLDGAPEGYAEALPYEVRGMLRSRANTIEGGTSEINRNIVGERVLGLPREPDPWHDRPWSEIPRN